MVQVVQVPGGVPLLPPRGAAESGEPMKLREKVEASPVFWFLSFLVGAFGAGFATPFAIMQAANLDLVQEGNYVLKEDVEAKYVQREKVGAEYVERSQVQREYIKKEEMLASYVQKSLCKPGTGSVQTAELPETGVTGQSPTTTTLQVSKNVAETEGFRFSLLGCTSGNEEISCELLVTNQKLDRDMSLSLTPNNTLSSRVIDAQGNESLAIRGSLGSREGTRVKSMLPSGVSVKLRLHFPKVGVDADDLALLQVGFIQGIGIYHVKFRL